MKADERKCPRCAEAIKSDALVCKHCGHELSAEEVEAGRAAAKKRHTMAGVGCLGLIALIVLPLAMCSSETSSVPQSPLEVDSHITKADYAGSNLNLWVDLGETGDAPVLRAAVVIEKLGKAIKAGMPGPTAETEFVQVLVRGPTVGRLGEEGTSKYFQMRFALDDLKRANYDNLTWLDMLNIADEIYVRGVAAPAVREFCSEHADTALQFCAQAIPASPT